MDEDAWPTVCPDPVEEAPDARQFAGARGEPLRVSLRWVVEIRPEALREEMRLRRQVLKER